jgi:predicted metal-dependent phosphoesterase TrpH
VLSPRDLVAHARDRGLYALAVTDHDTVAGIAEARDAAGVGLELVPGIELSTSWDGRDLHILGYFLDPEHIALRARLWQFRDERLARMRAIVERLDTLGLPVDPADVLALAGPGVVGRPHVAEALVRAGHVADLDDAFRRLLGARGSAYVPRPAFGSAEAIALVHAAGGVSVLAHPGALESEAIERLADAGLRGIEVWHPQHHTAAVRRHRAIAQRLGLLETGGSDFHGPGRGMDLGELPVPSRVLADLKDAAGISA